jgi:hypothetical protein
MGLALTNRSNKNDVDSGCGHFRQDEKSKLHTRFPVKINGFDGGYLFFSDHFDLRTLNTGIPVRLPPFQRTVTNSIPSRRFRAD